jgi:hypothetical protein
MSKISNIDELRAELIAAFEMVKADPRRAIQTKEMTNAAGKVIGTVKTELEYAAMKKEAPNIPFLHYKK